MGCLVFGIALFCAAALSWHWGLLSPVVSWLVVINLIAFLTYGYDKSIAGGKKSRVPEKVLLALALAGGTIGALLSMHALRHKTSKKSFLVKFWIILLAQVAVVAGYYMFF